MALLHHIRTAWRERAGSRRAWFALARTLPASSRLSWNATVLGRAICVGARTAIGPGAVLHCGSHAGEAIAIGSDCRIAGGARVMTWGGRITIGDHSSLNANVLVYGTGGVAIGRHVRIAAATVIVASQHVFERADQPIDAQGYTAQGIVIEDDVWLGAGVSVLDGVRIGTGAIVGAGAVVTRNVAPRTIVGGVPAAVLRERGGEPAPEKR